MEVVAAVLKRLNVQCAMDGDVFRIEPLTAESRRPHHDRALAWVPERSRSAS